MLLCLVHQCKSKCLPDCQVGHVLIILRIVVNLTTVPSLLLFSRYAAVGNLSLDSGKNLTLICDDFKKCGTARIRPTEHQHHFPVADSPGEIVNEISCGRRSAEVQ